MSGRGFVRGGGIRRYSQRIAKYNGKSYRVNKTKNHRLAMSSILSPINELDELLKSDNGLKNKEEKGNGTQFSDANEVELESKRHVHASREFTKKTLMRKTIS